MENKTKVFDYMQIKLAREVAWTPVYWAMRARKPSLWALIHTLFTGRWMLFEGILKVEPYKEDLVLSIIRFYQKEMYEMDDDLLEQAGVGATYAWLHRGQLLFDFSPSDNRFLIHTKTWGLFRQEAMAWLELHTPQEM